MNKLATAALLLASACGVVQAGGSSSATMEVTFVIRAACTVQADAGAPQVACSQGTGYQVVRPQAAPAPAVQASAVSAQSGEAWQIIF